MLAHKPCKERADNCGSLDPDKTMQWYKFLHLFMHATACNNHCHSPAHVHASKEAFLDYTGNSFNEVLHMCVIVLLHSNKAALIPTQKPPNLVLAQQALYMLPDRNIYESVCILGETLDG